MTKKIVKSAVILLASTAMVACGGPGNNGKKTYTFREYVAVSPSNWNELTYQDNNDTEIMGFIGSNFFRFNYQFDANGKVKEDGSFVVDYDAATALDDVTEDYAGNEKYAVPENAKAGFAYKITLRDDLKWDDGTPIKAKDFVYTMKQQEDPLFKNYRADSFYNGSTVIHNAELYLKQGSSGKFASRSVFGGVYDAANDDKMFFDGFFGDEGEGNECSYIYSWFRGRNGSDYDAGLKKYGIGYILYLYGSADATFAATAGAALDGKTFTEIKADATLKALWDQIVAFWVEVTDEYLDFFVSDYTFPAVDFADVGIFVGEKENELVVVLDKALYLLKEDGSLSYKAAYNFASLPLVKEDLYEANKVAPSIDGGLWTSKYNSSVESTASWGPYKLTSFQAGKEFILEKNENWYGYGMDVYKGQYQTDKIICETIAEWNTAFLKFKAGDIQTIGIDVSVSQDYKNSERAVFTASDFVSSLQLQSDADALKERSSSSKNKMLLTYPDFRKALSLAIDRADYCQKCTTASLAGYGIFNSMHYYDVENSGVYRNTDYAKQVICDTYGVKVEDYASLDEAYAAVTGYNLALARQLVDKAYDEAKAAGDIADGDKVVLTVGAAEATEATFRQFNYLKNAFENLAVGTKLEGNFTLEFNATFGSKWATDFRNGAYDICTGGWTGAAWDPGYFLLAYLSPDYMYSTAWKTDEEMLTYNPWGDTATDPDGTEHKELTMSLIDWYDCLNGATGADYDWSEGAVPNDMRLGIIAQLEKAILAAYYTVPIAYSFSASLVSYKIEYISKVYNTFMGYGGIRYITYTYDDAAWEKVKGNFDYTK